MNLGQYIAQQLLEAEGKQTIAVFPGAFKPPHRGHFEVVKKLLQNADQVVVLVSPKTREGVTADESVAVWELYKTLLDNNVEIRVALENPVRETYDLVKKNPDTNFIVAFGKDDASRFKRMDYPNVKVFDAGTVDAVNATGLRNAIQSNNADAIAQFIPDGINLIDFTDTIGKKMPPPEDKGEEVTIQEKQFQNVDDAYEAIVNKARHEIEIVANKFNVPIPDMLYAFIAGNMIVLSNDILDKLENKEENSNGEIPLILNYDKDKYYLVRGGQVLRKAGKIAKALMATLNLGQPKQTKLMEVKKLNESETGTIGEFIKFAIKNLGIQNPPRNLSLSYDTAKAKEMRSFGYFDPNSNKIWVYCGNRNMGDILRTLAHELVHRKQDEDGRISYESGKTGSEIENEANAKAGVLLRDFGKQHEEIYQ
jgi:cytidyltransferase-like protein